MIRRPFAAAALAAAVVSAAPAVAKVFDPEVFTLDNGMQVVVLANPQVPAVTHMVWYKVGAADDPAGKSGIAHTLEHLMFKGTETMGPGEFSSIIARNGGRENAFTGYDFTAYFQTIAPDRLDLMMTHEADRMRNLVLTDDVVTPEVDVVREERRSRIDNDVGAQWGEAMNASLWQNHPYGLPIIGWDHEIETLDREDALAFYERWYGPDNAILIVAGNVTADEVRRLAEKHYGPIPRRDIAPRNRPAEPLHRVPRRVEFADPQVRQPSFRKVWVAPSYTTDAPNGATKDQVHALQVLSDVLGGGTTSRLYRSLVVEQGIAVSAGSGYSGGSFDLSRFSVYASPTPGSDDPRAALATIETAVAAEIAKLIDEGPTEDEMTRAKTQMRASAIYALDGLSTGARVLGGALASGRTVEDVESWPARIEAVTAEDVVAAAKALFDDKASVTGFLLPEPNS